MGQGHFLRHKFFFHDFFFVLVCFQDEVKQLSSWKIFDWNRFGNDVFEPKNSWSFRDSTSFLSKFFFMYPQLNY